MTIRTKKPFTDKETRRDVAIGEMLIVPRARGLDLIAAGVASKVSDDDIGGESGGAESRAEIERLNAHISRLAKIVEEREAEIALLKGESVVEPVNAPKKVGRPPKS